jgi:subtilisin family serine protease
VENGCRVISMSFGGPNRDPVLEQTIDHYYDEGIVFVAASGNETSDAYSSPSDYPTVISVNSSTRRNEPSYLVYIAEKISQIYGKTTEEIKNITTENAKRLFF